MHQSWFNCLILASFVQCHNEELTIMPQPSGVIHSGLTATGGPNIGPLHQKWFIQGTDEDNSHIVIRMTYFGIHDGENGFCFENRLILSPSPDVTLCGMLNTTNWVYTSERGHMYIEYRVVEGRSCRGFELVYNTTVICGIDQFKCENEYCISSNLVCNGVNDCNDNSDEINCPVSTTSTDAVLHTTLLPCQGSSSFICVDLVGKERCFPNSEICNGHPVCMNKTDEKGCEHKCKSALEGPIGFFMSPNYPFPYPRNANCIWYINVKSGYTITLHVEHFHLESRPSTDFLALYDGSSEDSPRLAWLYGENVALKKITSKSNRVFAAFHSNGNAQYSGFNITYQQKGSCLPDQVLCEGEEDCYSEVEHCDGFWDCRIHGADEKGCNKCSSDRFSCGSGLQCYTEKDRCNGMGHCFNKKDEMNCGEDQCGTHNGTFLCHNQLCIYESWRCDGANDCGDNSDELICSVSNKVIIAAVLGSLICGTLLLIALGCMCKLHALRVQSEQERHNSRYISPLTRVQEEIFNQRSAPPGYQEAMITSRPYEEARREFLQQLEASGMTTNGRSCLSAEDNNPDSTMVQVVPSPVMPDHPPPWTPSSRLEHTVQEDDEDEMLIDITDNNGLIEPSESQTVRILLSTDITARWRRGRPKVTRPPSRSYNCLIHQASGSDDAAAAAVSLVTHQRQDDCTCMQLPPPSSHVSCLRNTDGRDENNSTHTPIDCDIKDIACENQATQDGESSKSYTLQSGRNVTVPSDCDTLNDILNCDSSPIGSNLDMQITVPSINKDETRINESCSSSSSSILDDSNVEMDVKELSVDTQMLLA